MNALKYESVPVGQTVETYSQHKCFGPCRSRDAEQLNRGQVVTITAHGSGNQHLPMEALRFPIEGRGEHVVQVVEAKTERREIDAQQH